MESPAGGRFDVCDTSCGLEGGGGGGCQSSADSVWRCVSEQRGAGGRRRTCVGVLQLFSFSPLLLALHKTKNDPDKFNIGTVISAFVCFLLNEVSMLLFGFFFCLLPNSLHKLSAFEASSVSANLLPS